MQLNQQTVNDAAAQLFWRMAQIEGVQAAVGQVLHTQGLCLLKQPCTAETLETYGFSQCDASAQRAFLDAVIQEAHEYTAAEQNLQGMIFLEDAATGRSPSATDIRTAHLDVRSPIVQVSAQVERIGRLCIRAPLPAVVFSDVRPQEGAIVWVDDTTTALGFHAPMFLVQYDCMPVNGLYVLTGVFSIAVSDPHTGKQWHPVIPNSTRFVSQLLVQSPAGQAQVDVSWE